MLPPESLLADSMTPGLEANPSDVGMTGHGGSRPLPPWVGDRQRGVLIGATLVTPCAGEILGELVLAIKLRTPLKTLADVIHPFPAFNRMLGASLEDLAAKAALQSAARS